MKRSTGFSWETVETAGTQICTRRTLKCRAFFHDGTLCLARVGHAQIFGGAIANFGGDLTFNAGVLFKENFAESSGEGGVGGGLYAEDGGVVT